MPLDTSIPLQFNQAAPTQAINPMTLYQLMQDRQSNALRAQMYQQEMAKNAMVMQNTTEDRKAAAANAAAAKAALARRNAILGQFGTTDAAVGERGAGYSGTGANADPYDFVRNKLIRSGDVGEAANIAELQNKTLAGQKTTSEIKGVDLNNIDKRIKTLQSIAPMVDTAEGAASFSQLMTQILPEFKAIAGDPSEAAARNIEAFSKDPKAWRAGVSGLSAQQLIDATKPPEYDIKETAQGLIQVPKGGGEAKPVTMGGAPVMPKPSAQQEKAAIQTKQLQGSVDTAISTLEDLIKPDSLLNKSTASGAGALTDKAAGFFGYATPGSVAAAQLKVLADPILKMIPRFEGPQSDKDTMSYKEAAGQLGNEYLPAAQRKAAAETILKLFKARRDQFTSADLPEAVVGAPAASAGNKAVFDAADAILGGQ